MKPHSAQPTPPRPVTMRSVGERAGVSATAVSLALREHPSLPLATRRRIQKLAAQMGYRPNPMVAALMASIHTQRTQGESPVLALVLEEAARPLFASVPYYQELFAGVRARAEALGYKVEEFTLPPGVAAGRHLHRVLTTRGIRGVILGPTFHQEGRITLPLDGVACCALGHSQRSPCIHRVGSHHRQAVALGWSHLAARGYRRPGYVQVSPQLKRGEIDRLGSFLALQAMHPEFGTVPPLFIDGPLEANLPQCVETVLAWYEAHQPDVLMGVPWALHAPLAARLKIPREVGVITFDLHEGWTRVREPAENIGAGAVDLIVAQIHRNETGVPPFPKTMLVESTWVEGGTLRKRGARSTAT